MRAANEVAVNGAAPVADVLFMCRSSLVRGSDRRCSNDPQRGVGQDQTPLRVATTSRLGTLAMLGARPQAVQRRFVRDSDDPLSICSPIGWPCSAAGGILVRPTGVCCDIGGGGQLNTRDPRP